MLNRIFKTILVLSICVGISLPTNAAVSVSDGSAFVTKAEFAADLNNLSNRMAQLENSLDAKIDSLVSSYLTRNGIWNGARQSMNSVPTSTFGFAFDEVFTGAWAYVLNSDVNTTNSFYAVWNNLTVYTPRSLGGIDNVCIQNVSKSGLCNFIIGYDDTVNKVRVFNSVVDGTYMHGDYWGCNYILEYMILANGTDLKYYDAFNYSMPIHADYTIALPTLTNCYFFISKGDEVSVKLVPKIEKSARTVCTTEVKRCLSRISYWDANIY